MQESKAVILEDEITLPRILLSVALHDCGDGFKICFLKLRRDDFGDLGGGVGLHIVHAFLQSVGEGLNDFRVLFEIALLGGKGSVGNIAGIFAKRSDHIAVAFRFKGSRVGFEFYSVCFLLHQFCEKIKTTYLMGFLVNLYILDRAFPEGLFMAFIQLKV